jgi:hypothetical protein
MSLLFLYDPPARMNDFDAIPGQRLAWHQFLVEQFKAQIDGLADTFGQALNTQFYEASQYDPGGSVIEQAVVWNAFPKELLRRFGRSRALVEADRVWPVSAYRYDWVYDSDDPAHTFAAPVDSAQFATKIVYRPTVEYCEWHVDRDPTSGRIKRVSFTSEPPEYWLAMAGGRMDGVQSLIDFPGDKRLVLELYRKFVNPGIELADLLATSDYTSPLGTHKIGDYDPYNKWNTTHGAMHLCAPPNSLVAEINLAANSTLIYQTTAKAPVVDPDAFITGTGFGGPNRNSDPTIAATVNVLARLGAMITLANPVGLYMDHIDLTGWEVPGGVAASDCARVVRGAPNMIERLVVEYPTNEFDICDILIGGVPIHYGGQIAECITVKLVGAAAALGSVKNTPALIAGAGYVDPADARQIFNRGRGEPLRGLVRAFVGEAGEVEPSAPVAAPATTRSRRLA